MTNIVLALDSGSIDLIGPLLKSIKNNVKDYNIIIITDNEITVDGCTVIVKDAPWKSKYARITGHTYYRLFLDEWLDVDKCIYLDFDTLVLDDISNILDGDDWMLKASGVEDKYFNAGVLAFNFTPECRSLMSKCREMINSTDYDDQQILNTVFKGNFLNIGIEYNISANRSEEIACNPKILHFIGLNKPWHVSPYYKYYLQYKDE